MREVEAWFDVLANLFDDDERVGVVSIGAGGACDRLSTVERKGWADAEEACDVFGGDMVAAFVGHTNGVVIPGDADEGVGKIGRAHV